MVASLISSNVLLSVILRRFGFLVSVYDMIKGKSVASMIFPVGKRKISVNVHKNHILADHYVPESKIECKIMVQKHAKYAFVC